VKPTDEEQNERTRTLKGFNDEMSTFTQIYYHIVFSTKNREPVLIPDKHKNLFQYVWGIIKNKKSHLYCINAMEDHLHILTSLPTTVCLADLVKDIKVSTSRWIKETKTFPHFSNWQDGYGAFTHSTTEKQTLIEYIKRQAQHHKKTSFQEELRTLLKQAGIPFDERYLI